MKFQIEQIAIVPKDPIAAKKLLSEIGATEWSEDHVVATGNVFGVRDTNEADLSFNYDLFSGKEFEVLDYTSGPNWVDSRGERNTVSHLGMHSSRTVISKWRKKFSPTPTPIPSSQENALTITSYSTRRTYWALT